MRSVILREIREHIDSDRPEIPRIWMIAAIFGALWGSLEITLGAFIHALRIPFCGLFLTAVAAFILIVVARLYPMRGLLIRIGLIAALCKSLSPGGLIVTPMIAIFMEGLLAEAICSSLGLNFFSAALVGFSLVAWSFFQGVIVSILLYGGSMVDIYRHILRSASVLFEASPETLIFSMLAAFAVIGTAGTWSALIFFERKRDSLLDFGGHSKWEIPPADENAACERERGKGRWFAAAILTIAFAAFAMQFLGHLLWSLAGLALLLLVVGGFQRGVLRKFAHPRFWIFSLAVVVLSGLAFGRNFRYVGGFLPYSDGVGQGFGMVVRAAILYLAILSCSRLLNARDFDRAFRRLGRAHMGAVLRRAFDLLPRFVEIYRKEFEMRQGKEAPKRFSPPRRIGESAQGGKAREGWFGSFLASVFSSAVALVNERGIRVWAVVGDRAKGKTSCLCGLADLLAEEGIAFKAILQPRSMDGSETIGYKLRLVPGMEEMELARSNESGPGYSFEKRGFRRAERFLRASPHVRVHVVDEMGRLELEGKGHFPYVFAGMHTWGELWILSMREDRVADFEKKLRIKFERVFSVSAEMSCANAPVF